MNANYLDNEDFSEEDENDNMYGQGGAPDQLEGYVE